MEEEQRRVKFELPDGCSCETFTLRETTGKDEEIATQRAAARGSSEFLGEELARRCIVEVNGDPVQDPYPGLKGWNSKTRSLLIQAFSKINIANEVEVEAFLLSAVEPN